MLGQSFNNLLTKSPPNWMQGTFQYFSKPGPDIYPLEGSVIVGRTIAAQQRGGPLEVQERIPEEIGAAIVWLKCVNWMCDLFDYAMKKRKNGNLRGDTAWNWPGGKTRHIDLTPQELYTRNATERSKLLLIKSGRWLFSVGIALSLVAYFIPKLNQMKTNWVLRHFYRKPENQGATGQINPQAQTTQPHPQIPIGQSSAGSNLQSLPNHANGPQSTTPLGINETYAGTFATSPTDSSQTGTQGASGNENIPPHASIPIFSAANGALSQAHGLLWGPALGQQGQAFKPTQPQFGAGNPLNWNQAQAALSEPTHPLPRQTGPASSRHSLPIERRPGIFAEPNPPATRAGDHNPQFGAGFSLSNVLQGAGHMVEQTPYGSILVVDMGIILGRGMVASARSVYETLEVAVRDIGSLYFYILAVPHMMKAMGAILNGMSGGRIESPPKMMEALSEALKQRLPERATVQDVEALLNGNTDAHLQSPKAWLKREMRQAPREAFLNLWEKEASVYVPGIQSQLPQLRNRLLNWLPAEQKTLNTKNLYEDLMPAIEQGKGEFAPLNRQARKDLIVALKQAFRHTNGLAFEQNATGEIRLRGKLLKDISGLSHAWEHQSNAHQRREWEALHRRLDQNARIDGLNVANTMSRRMINVLRSLLPDTPWIAEAEGHAEWLDKASNLHLTLEDTLKLEFESIQSELKKLPDSTGVKHLRELAKDSDQMSMQQLKELKESLQRYTEGQSEAHGVSQLWQSPMRKLANQRAKSLLEKINALPTPATHNPSTLWKTSTAQGIANGLSETLAKAQATLGTQHPRERALLAHYQKELEQIIHQQTQPHYKGRLFSMALEEQEGVLNQKVAQMLQGGLNNDQAFLRKIQIALGQFTPDSHLYDDPVKRQNLSQAMKDYSEALLKHLRNEAQKNGINTFGRAELDTLVSKFFRMNQNLHFFARSLAMVGAMWGLGWLVPKVQYALTHRLTGKNVNPGIESAENAVGVGEPKTPPPATENGQPLPVGMSPSTGGKSPATTTSGTSSSPNSDTINLSNPTQHAGNASLSGLNRNHFTAFRRPEHGQAVPAVL